MPPVGAGRDFLHGGRGRGRGETRGRGSENGSRNGQKQWLKKEIQATDEHVEQVEATSTSLGEHASSGRLPIQKGTASASSAAEGFPPLSPDTTPASDAGSGLADSAAAAAAAAERERLAAEERAKEKDELSYLVPRLQLAEQRLASRLASSEKLRHELPRLRAETEISLKEEKRLREEAAADRLTGSNQKEALRGRHAELFEKLEAYARRTEEHNKCEREFREDFETLDRQQATAAEQVLQLQRTNASLKAEEAESSQHLQKAEARLKRLEARRAELKAEAGRLQEKLARQLEAEDAPQASERQCLSNSAPEKAPGKSGLVTQPESAAGAAESKAPRPSKSGKKAAQKAKASQPSKAAEAPALQAANDSNGKLLWQAISAVLLIMVAILLLPKFSSDSE
eukprot:TRINITY_DN81930_c0_g1_i1.p1 TRINITY_DN81930_c0_g1~~TRINITY_DN81930_c0_g1_i1.p1  ORF type:complete len:400 (-),score=136.42 TRINITY_DN81930_c0_g1_i1:28-1227(-)